MSGAFTNEAKTAYRAGSVQLMELENMGFRLGMMTGKHTRGRKPTGIT
jgi:hypothetical protein